MIPLMIMVFTELVLSLLTGTVIIILLATIGTGKAVVEIAVVIGLVVFFETYLLLVFRAYYMQVSVLSLFFIHTWNNNFTIGI